MPASRKKSITTFATDYTVTFMGETGRPGTGAVVIVGREFIRGTPVTLTSSAVQQLRDHPDFNRFIFDIRRG